MSVWVEGKRKEGGNGAVRGAPWGPAFAGPCGEEPSQIKAGGLGHRSVRQYQRPSTWLWMRLVSISRPIGIAQRKGSEMDSGFRRNWRGGADFVDPMCFGMG